MRQLLGLIGFACLCLSLHARAEPERAPSGAGENNEAERRVAVPLPPDCGAGVWVLDEAGANPSLEDVTYNEKWTPILEAAQRCVALPTMQRACLEVRGHSDKLPFASNIVAAYGSMQAAQMVRARARGEIVLSKLHDLGVRPLALRSIPSSFEPTFRGVAIRLIPDCVEPAPVMRPTSEQPATNSVGTPILTNAGQSVETSNAAAQESHHLSLWFGPRFGVAVPVAQFYRAEANEWSGPSYRDVAGTGANLELDVGLRPWRSVLLFGLWERTWFSQGNSSEWSNYAAGRTGLHSDYLAIAGQWRWQSMLHTMTHIELASGYRWLSIDYHDGTKMRFGSPLETRIGIGVEYSPLPRLAIEALLNFSGGVYTSRNVEYPASPQVPLGGEGRFHGMISFGIGGHYEAPLQ